MQFLTGVSAAFIGLASIASAQSSGSAILVLDGSGSMWGQIDGTAKITIAQDVVQNLLGDLPADQSLGLTVYGHRRKGDCSDIETLVMPGMQTRDAIANAVRAIKPKGKTPMTDAVIAAAKALRYTEEKATVILVSDGIETCAPDPCAAARALEDAGVDFTAHVVGFDVTDPEALAQMQCLADETGGSFRTASDADSLGEVLVGMMKEPEPVPVDVNFSARMDSITGPLVDGTVLWDVTGEAGGILAETAGNPLVHTMTDGAYTASAYWVEQELQGEATFSVTNTQQSVVVVFDTPLPKASITAQQTAVAGTQLDVGWSGPNDTNDNIQIGPVGKKWQQYTYTRKGNPLTLQLPAQPGAYELRYAWKDKEIIATVPITLTEAELSLTFPAQIAAGSSLEVTWAGPNAPLDNIQIGPVGGGYESWTYTERGNPAKLIAPAEPGAYEVRYVFQDRETILSQPITVTEAALSMTAPETILGGSSFEVAWEGPDATGDNIQIAPVGGSYLDWTYTKNGNPAKLTAPVAAGDYELRYVFRDRETILTRPVKITPPNLALSAPASVKAGSTFEVTWDGPNANGDNVQIAPVGGGYLAYKYTSQGNPVSLTAPDTPGAYELRYVFRDRETIHTVPITVE